MTFFETRCLLTPSSHQHASGFCPTLSEQGFDPAAAMVLHTCNQKLEARAHVHSVVPGGCRRRLILSIGRRIGLRSLRSTRARRRWRVISHVSIVLTTDDSARSDLQAELEERDGSCGPSVVVWFPSSDRRNACIGVLAPVTILGIVGTRPLRRDKVQRTIYPAAQHSDGWIAIRSAD